MKKAFKIIIPTLLVILAIFYVVAYILWKEQTTYITECVINFINKPLPIIGVSTGVVLFFIYKCFISTKYGKKAINEYKEENRALKERIDELEHKEEDIKDFVVAQLQLISSEQCATKSTLIKSLELSKNIKIKELAKTLKGEQPYGEEEIDSDTEKEEI